MLLFLQVIIIISTSSKFTEKISICSRAFFRRAGTSVFLCLTGDNKCNINKETRTKCKRCRYQRLGVYYASSGVGFNIWCFRCLEAGMKPELVDRTLATKKKKEEYIVETKLFSCSFCVLSFSEQTDLNLHMLTHS